MGKKKKEAHGHGDGQHSASTVFVTNLPFSLTNAQFEEAFSDVGPIRRCFMVMKKGSTEHRGFGYVQFASVEDANRAIELKNGSPLGGRKIIVKQAMQRAPLEQRRGQETKVHADDATHKNDIKDVPTAKADDAGESLTTQVEGKVAGKKRKLAVSNALSVEGKDVSTAKGDDAGESLTTQVRGKVVEGKRKPAVSDALPVEGKISDKQRIAKTVIFGGLNNADMAEEVHRRAREFGTVCSVTYPLPEGELKHHGLAQDGCRKDASSVLYTSVKSARACVAALHQKNIHGGFVWARQLGGEGAKTQKWKLILRNLPFQAKVSEIRDMFAAVGHVWDVFIPQNPETGLSRGFAFVKFTSKQDVESAIQKFNGKNFGKRPIAVDWAVSKKVYTDGNKSVAAADGQEEDDESSIDLEDDYEKSEKGHDSDNDGDESDSFEKNGKTEVNFDEEAEISKSVIKKLISSHSADASGNNDSELSEEEVDNESVRLETKSPDASSARVLAAASAAESKQNATRPPQEEDELQRTLFINNIPFDISVEEVRERFSAFGEVQSFFPVLHPVTKRPRGTGFLKFKTADAASAAFSAANAAAGLGILLKGRQLKVLKALDKKAANDKASEKAKKEDHDHRNLYLAKEGLIMEETPAAEGVSAFDMAKRKKLQEDKTTKLRSPNFRVSRTRLIVYNVPKTMQEKQLKQIFIDAVLSRATKQKPSILQIKILKDSKKGKEGEKSRPRGVAFLEFTEHQHALVALRVLNNNPDTFGPEHRPIVEFALDNVQKLKLRNDKLDAQHRTFPNNKEDLQHSGRSKSMMDSHTIQESRKRKSRADGALPRNPKNRKEEVPNQVSKEIESGDSDSSKKFKESQNGDGKKFPAEKRVKESKKEVFNQLRGKKPNSQAALPKDNSVNLVSTQESKEAGMRWKRRLSNDQPGSNEGMNPRNRKRNKKDPVGRDVVDKLDLLIEQYRSKFTQNDSVQSDNKKQGSKQLKRWFE